MQGGGYCSDFSAVVDKGINLPYVFGNNTYMYVRPNNDIPAQLPLGPVYRPARLNNVLIPTDFEDLNSKGFRSVRIPIEPMIFGCTASNSYLNMADEPFKSNYFALVNTVTEATDAGLGVILDLHPIVVSGADFTWWKSTYGNGSTITWTGPYLQDWAISVDAPTNSHPLVQFWGNFAFHLNASGVLNREVALEVLNEPAARFRSSGPLNQTPGLVEEISGNPIISSSDRIDRGWQHWRELQKLAINAIQTVNDDVCIIATTWKSEYKDLEDDFDFESKIFTPYDSNEVIAKEKLAYNLHVYTPYRYTLHPWPLATSNEPNYRESRDKLFNTLFDDPEGIGQPPTQNPNDFYLQHTISKIELWRALNNYPSVCVTEFGANNRQAPANYDGWTDMDDPIYTPDQEQMRGQWLYDARKQCEDINFRWVVYEYVGSKKMFKGQMENYQDITAHSSVTNRTWVSGFVQQGLFGARP